MPKIPPELLRSGCRNLNIPLDFSVFCPI